MHKICSIPAPKNWRLYLKEGIPVIGSMAINVGLIYSSDEERAVDGYEAQPDMPVYSAKIRPIGTDSTATSPVKFITDDIMGVGEPMKLVFPNQEVISLLKYIATGQVPAENGWLTVRFTFKRIGPRVFATLFNYCETETQ